MDEVPCPISMFKSSNKEFRRFYTRRDVIRSWIMYDYDYPELKKISDFLEGSRGTFVRDFSDEKDNSRL